MAIDYLAQAVYLLPGYSLKSDVAGSQVICYSIPFSLEKPDPAIESLISSTTAPTSLSAIFGGDAPGAVGGLRWALKFGRPVDIDIQATLSDSLLEGFEDLIAKASADLETVPPIVLCAFSLSIIHEPISDISSHL